MKQLFMALIVSCLFIFPSYANAEKCDYIFTDNEIEKELDNLLEGGTYKDKAASGVFCVNLEDLMKLQFKMKNGKINGGMRIAFYHEKNKPVFDTYISDYSIFTDFDNVFDDNGLPNYEFLKNKKIDLNSKVYYENGNIQVNCTTINGAGSCTSYKENGAMDIYRPISNYQYNGKAEVYSENGRLWATLNYVNGDIVSAECINDRKNGKKWTKAEISNWNNGLEVSCNYF